MTTVIQSVGALVSAQPSDWISGLRPGDPVGVLIVTARYYEDTKVAEVLPGAEIICSDNMHYVSGVCKYHERDTRYLLKPTPETTREYHARQDRNMLRNFRWQDLTAEQLRDVSAIARQFLDERKPMRGQE